MICPFKHTGFPCSKRECALWVSYAKIVPDRIERTVAIDKLEVEEMCSFKAIAQAAIVKGEREHKNG